MNGVGTPDVVLSANLGVSEVVLLPDLVLFLLHCALVLCCCFSFFFGPVRWFAAVVLAALFIGGLWCLTCELS
jgi:hypothetical protein